MAGRPPGALGAGYHPVIDPGTSSRSESHPPGPLCSYQPVPQHRDEITPIAHYIAHEMNTNAHGADAKRMAEMNSFSANACITDFTKLPLWKQILGAGIQPEQCIKMEMSFATAALIAWGMKVKQNGDWDHKPKIAQRFNPRSPGLQHLHLYGNTVYNYDIWSNLHYGYVGCAAGFSESVLLDGAGLEQIGSTLRRFRELPKRDSTTSGLRAWDDPKDRTAITRGIALYRSKPQGVTGQDIMNLVLTYVRLLNTEPYPR